MVERHHHFQAVKTISSIEVEDALFRHPAAACNGSGGGDAARKMGARRLALIL